MANRQKEIHHSPGVEEGKKGGREEVNRRIIQEIQTGQTAHTNRSVEAAYGSINYYYFSGRRIVKRLGQEAKLAMECIGVESSVHAGVFGSRQQLPTRYVVHGE